MKCTRQHGRRTIIGASRIVQLIILANLIACGERTYDLRGPDPRQGLVTQHKTTMTLKNATLTLTDPQGVTEGRMERVGNQIETYFIDTVADGQVTSYRQRIVTDEEQLTIEMRGQKDVESPKGPLVGQTIRHQKTGGKWRRNLISSFGLPAKPELLATMKPTQVQKEAMDALASDLFEIQVYPEKPVPVGHRWTVDASMLQRLMGPGFSNVSGEATMVLEKVIRVGEDERAVLQTMMTLKGEVPGLEGELETIELQMMGTTHRSLKSGLDVSSEMNGHAVLHGRSADGGSLYEIRGSVSIASSEELDTKLSSATKRKGVNVIERIFAPDATAGERSKGVFILIMMFGALERSGRWFTRRRGKTAGPPQPPSDAKS